MKANIVTTLLLLGTLALAGTAHACPVDDAAVLADAVVACASTIPGSDGQPDVQTHDFWLGVDVIERDPACLA